MTESTRPFEKSAIHHVAFACRDIEQTHHFYGDLLGLELMHTEMTDLGQGFFRHTFYDTGDGSAIAFFDMHGVGEPENLRTAISTDLDLPLWVNHIALRSTPERNDEVRSRMKAEGIRATMVLDHDWCQSRYYTDPNGILVELCVDTPGMPYAPDKALAALTQRPEAHRSIESTEDPAAQ